MMITIKRSVPSPNSSSAGIDSKTKVGSTPFWILCQHNCVLYRHIPPPPLCRSLGHSRFRLSVWSRFGIFGVDPMWLPQNIGIDMTCVCVCVWPRLSFLGGGGHVSFRFQNRQTPVHPPGGKLVEPTMGHKKRNGALHESYTCTSMVIPF
jgi:hypothetical protein